MKNETPTAEPPVSQGLAMLQDTVKVAQVRSELLSDAIADTDGDLCERSQRLGQSLRSSHEGLRSLRDSVVAAAADSDALRSTPGDTGPTRTATEVAPAKLLKDAIEKLHEFSTTLKDISQQVGDIPKALATAATKMSTDAIRVAGPWVKSVASQTDAVAASTIDQANLDLLQGMSKTIKPLHQFGRQLLANELVGDFQSLSTEVHGEISKKTSGGTPMRQALLPLCKRIQTSMKAMSQLHGVAEFTALNKMVSVLDATIDDIPEQAINILSVLLPLELLQQLADSVEGSVASHAQSQPLAQRQAASGMLGASNHTEFEFSAMGIIATCTAIEGLAGAVGATFPFSIYVETGPMGGGNAGISAGVAAGVAVNLGLGVSAGLGAAAGLSICNTMNFLTGTIVSIAGMVRIGFESAFVGVELTTS